MLSRPHNEPDAGMTLVELIVGMTLMAIVGAIALNFFLGTTAQASRVGEQSLVGASARTALTQIVKTLQVADSSTSPGASSSRFVTVTGTEIAFYSNVSNVSRNGTAQRVSPSLIDFKLTKGALTESITPPGANPVSSTNTLVTGVTGTTIFTYCSDVSDPTVSCTATSNPASVAMVQISVTVQGLRGTTPQTVQSGVAIEGALS